MMVSPSCWYNQLAAQISMGGRSVFAAHRGRWKIAPLSAGVRCLQCIAAAWEIVMLSDCQRGRRRGRRLGSWGARDQRDGGIKGVVGSGGWGGVGKRQIDPRNEGRL